MGDITRVYVPDGGGFGGNGMEGMLLGSMMNGGMMGGNGMWNSPWWALIFLSAFRNGGFFGGGGNGENGQFNAIQEHLNTIQGQNALTAAIQGGTNETRALANQLGCDFNAVQSAINAVQSAICGVSNQVGMSSQSIINAVNNGQRDIINQLSSCCCDIRESVTKMGYDNQLSNLQQTNVMQNGFSQLGYALRDQTCALQQGNDANTRAILGKLDAMEDSRKDREIAALTAQNATLQARAERQAELAPLYKGLADVQCKLPKTESVYAPSVVGLPACVAYQYGLGLNGLGLGQGTIF